MAEVAAGAIAAEQIISTGVEAGAAATIARPTQLSKVSLRQINIDVPALARSNHTVTVIGESAYIFGGKGADGETCPPNVHEIPLPSEKNQQHGEHASYHPSGAGDAVPEPRFGHAACARKNSIVIHGGQNGSGVINEGGDIWLWDAAEHLWIKLVPLGGEKEVPSSRHGHSIFYDEKSDSLILFGGESSTETWIFDFLTAGWTQLASAPVASTGAVFSAGTLYSLTSDSGRVASLKISGSTPATDGWIVSETSSSSPTASSGAAVVRLNYGMGRTYLLQIFGAEHTDKSAGSDIWSLQLPADKTSGAGVKDAIRNVLPKVESGTWSWAEVEVSPPGADEVATGAKVHPGPRAYFGADDCGDGRRVIIWGGVSGNEKVEGDGWILEVS